MWKFRAWLAGALALALGCGVAAAEAPAVAAAADLKFVLPELAGQFERSSGERLRLVFGSSGTMARQIAQGARFELLLSADEQFVFDLAEQGLTLDRGVLYGIGGLVLFAPHGSPLEVDGELRGLRAALAEGRVSRFAIANPEHAPYGRAARAALAHAGLWTDIEPALVYGDNAAQAMQFAASGSSQGGLVPLSLSLAPEVARLGRFAPVPAEWHAQAPLRQRMVLLRRAGETARAFYAWLQGPEARERLRAAGFRLPAHSPGAP